MFTTASNTQHAAFAPQTAMVPNNFMMRQQQRRLRIGSPRQRRFLLGVKLIMRSLQTSGSPSDRILALQVKTTVKEYTRMVKFGMITGLQDKLEARLRQIVGDETFTQAMLLTDFYLAKRRWVC